MTDSKSSKEQALELTPPIDPDKRYPIPVKEIIWRLEGESCNTDTDPRWLAANLLRQMESWESRTLMCRVDQRPSVTVSTVETPGPGPMPDWARLLLECRDALPAISLTAARLRNLDLTLADRIEAMLEPWRVPDGRPARYPAPTSPVNGLGEQLRDVQGCHGEHATSIHDCQNLRCRATGKCIGTQPCKYVRPPQKAGDDERE